MAAATSSGNGSLAKMTEDQIAANSRKALIYLLPGKYKLIPSDEYMAEKHTEAELENR